MQNPLKPVFSIPRTNRVAAAAVALAALAVVFAACRGGGSNPDLDSGLPLLNPTISADRCIQHLQPEEAPHFSDIDQSRFIETESGLRYYDIEVGTGETPTIADAAVVEYTGWLTDGCMFDTSYLNEDPVTFPLVGVIRGWTDTFQTMQEGGTRVVEIPPDLAYGEVGRPPRIGKDATLIFHLHLLDRLTIPEAEATLESRRATATADAAEFYATVTAEAEQTAAAGTPVPGEETPGAMPPVESATPAPTGIPAPTVGP